MKKFLVPVDLSHSTDNAVKIAEKLAIGHETEIHILNIVSAPQGAVLSSQGELIIDNEFDISELKVNSEKNEKELLEKYAHVPNKTVSVILGDINRVIISHLNKGDYDLLILGMSGQLTTNFWTSSHTEYLSKESTVPVLSLKCDRSGMSLDKIAFVSDFLNDEDINLKILKELSHRFDSKIVLLKIVTADQKRTREKITECAHAFAEKNQLSNYEIQIFEASEVEDGIAMFCGEQNIDLIAIGTHQRGGFSTLFRKSVSQDIVRNLFHPILTIPIAT